MDLAVASATHEWYLSGKHPFSPSLHISSADPTANMGGVRGGMELCNQGQPQAALSLRWPLASLRWGQKGVTWFGDRKVVQFLSNRKKEVSLFPEWS